MAEPFVSTVLQKLARIPAEDALLADAGEEVRKIRNNLEAIHAVLEDAEEKQMADQSLKLWLDRLKDASYDMEDILDEVYPSVPGLSSSTDVSGYDFDLRIKEISKTLDEIAEEKDRYQLTTRENRQQRQALQGTSDDAEKDKSGPSLWSFHHLTPELKLCLTYCVIFPKDFTIWSHHLFHHWMAQGYLGLDNNAELEFIGSSYFKTLANPLFFHDFGIDERGLLHTVKMHDFIHDFIQNLVGDEFVTKEFECEEDSRLDISSNRTRHLTVKLAEGVHFPVSISGVKRLRSLVTFCGQGAITTEAMRNFFNQATRLRVLDFCWPDGNDHLGEQIPEEIGKLKQLRHLNLSFSRKLTELPETLCELYNLQFLMLKGCSSLRKLPDNFGKLISLRYLRSNLCDSLSYYPKGLGRLTSLRLLYEVIARADRNDPTEFSLGDLECLDKLHGILRVKLVGDVLDVSEAQRAKLQNKVHLKDLRIKLAGDISKDAVIQALNPPSTLNVRFYSLEEQWHFPD